MTELSNALVGRAHAATGLVPDEVGDGAGVR